MGDASEATRADRIEHATAMLVGRRRAPITATAVRGQQGRQRGVPCSQTFAALGGPDVVQATPQRELRIDHAAFVFERISKPESRKTSEHGVVVGQRARRKRSKPARVASAASRSSSAVPHPRPWNSIVDREGDFATVGDTAM